MFGVQVVDADRAYRVEQRDGCLDSQKWHQVSDRENIPLAPSKDHQAWRDSR